MSDPAGFLCLKLGLMTSPPHAGSDACNLGGVDGGGERDGVGDSEDGGGGGGGGSDLGDSNDGDDSTDNGFDCSHRGWHSLIGASSSGDVAAQVAAKAGGVVVDDRANVPVGGGADHGPNMPRLAIKLDSEDHHKLMVSDINAIVAYKNRRFAISKAVIFFCGCETGR